MKRELKFRAWIISQKKMIKVFGFNEHLVFEQTWDSPSIKENIFEIEDCVLMQFTGLYDIHGKEIYEGDTVKWGHLEGAGSEIYHRYAVVEINPDIQFRILYYIHSKTGERKETDGYVFRYGYFAYKNTEKYLEII